MRHQLLISKELRKMDNKITVDPKALKIRNKVELFKTVEGHAIVATIGVDQKSRILLKDVARFDEIYKKMMMYFNHTFSKRRLIINAPLCSKAKAKLLSDGWEVVEAG